MIREKIFHLTHQEVPYAVAVRVEELTERDEPGVPVHPGDRLRRAGLAEGHSHRQGRGDAQADRHRGPARARAFFGIKVFLELRVEVRRNWRKDERALREFGFRLTS